MVGMKPGAWGTGGGPQDRADVAQGSARSASGVACRLCAQSTDLENLDIVEMVSRQGNKEVVELINQAGGPRRSASPVRTAASIAQGRWLLPAKGKTSGRPRPRWRDRVDRFRRGDRGRWGRGASSRRSRRRVPAPTPHLNIKSRPRRRPSSPRSARREAGGDDQHAGVLDRTCKMSTGLTQRKKIDDLVEKGGSTAACCEDRLGARAREENGVKSVHNHRRDACPRRCARSLTDQGVGTLSRSQVRFVRIAAYYRRRGGCGSSTSNHPP